MTNTDTYTCENCGRMFEKGWSDDEAAVEAKRNFPQAKPEQFYVVCDTCFNRIMSKAGHVVPS